MKPCSVIHALRLMVEVVANLLVHFFKFIELLQIQQVVGTIGLKQTTKNVYVVEGESTVMMFVCMYVNQFTYLII